MDPPASAEQRTSPRAGPGTIAGLVVLGFVLAAGSLLASVSNETLTDLSVGRLIAETRSVPARDPLSFATGDTPWVAQSWLGQLAAFAAWRAGGFRAVHVLHVALLAGTALAVLGVARRRAPTGSAALLVSAALLGALLAVTPLATEAWSLLLLAAALLALERLREEPRAGPAVLLGAAAALSRQLDAGFVAVFAAIATALLAAALERAWSRARLVGLALLAATLSGLLHPGGPGALLHPLDYSSEPRLRELFFVVPGLGGTNFTTLPGRLVEAPLFLLLALAVTRRVRPRTDDVLLVLVFAHAAVTVERAVPFFLVVVAGPLAAMLDGLLPGRVDHRKAPLTLTAGLVAAALVGAPRLLDAQRDALDLAENLPETPRGALWNELDAGGALAWHRRAVWIDARHDLFAAAGVWRKHVKIRDAFAPWDDLVDRLRMDVAVVKPGSAIDRALRERGWREERRTPSLVVLVRG